MGFRSSINSTTSLHQIESVDAINARAEPLLFETCLLRSLFSFHLSHFAFRTAQTPPSLPLCDRTDKILAPLMCETQ